MKRYDLMQDINTRGTFVGHKACIPHLRAATNPHILTLSPPISLEPRWLGPHIALHDREVRHDAWSRSAWRRSCARPAIASNALWPRTLVATAAVQNLLGGDAAMAARAHARDLRRRRLRDPHPAEPRVHGQRLPVRGRARRGGRDRLQRLQRYVAGAELRVDLFVDHV